MGRFEKGNPHAFQKGHKKIPGSGGRSRSIRAVLTKVMPIAEMERMWTAFLHDSNKEIRFETFKLAIFYLYGRPAHEPLETEDRAVGGGPEFDTDNMPTSDERIN